MLLWLTLQWKPLSSVDEDDGVAVMTTMIKKKKKTLLLLLCLAMKGKKWRQKRMW